MNSVKVDQLAPEQAQRLTKEAWKARAENRAMPPGGTCGWCKFPSSDTCIYCPIHRIVRMPCWRITEYQQWQNATEPAERRVAALAILEWLERYEDRLIKAGHEILKEWKR